MQFSYHTSSGLIKSAKPSIPFQNKNKVAPKQREKTDRLPKRATALTPRRIYRIYRSRKKNEERKKREIKAERGGKESNTFDRAP